MTPEKEFFLSVLSDHIWGRKTNPCDDINWDIISTISHSHQLEGIIYYQCKSFLPQIFCSSFEKAYLSTLFHYSNNNYIIKELTVELEKAHIPFLTVKGMDVANCYPVPALRTMGDIDILVHIEDKEQAGQVFEKMRFQLVEKSPDYTWTYTLNGMQYELHHYLIYQETVTRKEQAEFFNKYWSYSKNEHLDWSFHFLFLLAHLRKHLMNRGVGFRMFMDLAVVIQKQALNWPWIEEKLYELNMTEFACVCFAMIKKWFSVSAPMLSPALEEDFVEQETEWIFTNGIFGFGGNNENNNVVNEWATKGNEPRVFPRLRMACKILFPSYQDMKSFPSYRFIKDKPWLYPVAWLFRIYRLLLGCTDNVNSIMGRVFTPQSIIDEREEQLRKWGLIE